MMKNFNTVTRKCEKNQENIQRALQSGQATGETSLSQARRRRCLPMVASQTP